MSIEQMVRDLLTKAMEDSLVASGYQFWDDTDPQARTSGELVGCTNLMQTFLKQERDRLNERWEKATGMTLDQAEETQRVKKQAEARRP